MQVTEYDEDFVVNSRKELEKYAKSFGYPIYVDDVCTNIWFIGFPSIRECIRSKYPLTKLTDSLSEEGLGIVGDTDIYLRNNKDYRRIY